MYKLFLMISITSICFSCKEQIEIKPTENVFFEVTNDDRSFASEMGFYENWFTRSDGFQKFGHHKSSLYSNIKQSKFGGYTEENQGKDRRLDEFFVNEYSLRTLRVLMSREEQTAYVDNYLGKTVRMRFVDKGEEIYNIPMYVPREISIDTTSSRITRISSGNIGRYKLGADLYINKDPNNSNGLLLTLSYRGYNLNITMDDIQNSSEEDVHIKKHLYVPEDSGVIEFPDGFFDGLPNGAMFYLQINRQNFHILNIGENSHKLSTGTGYGVNLALER